jgi:hypothetical protein
LWPTVGNHLQKPGSAGGRRSDPRLLAEALTLAMIR